MRFPITVMLVDDEPLALENVYEMVPWTEHGFQVAAKASNGRMALRLFQQHRPQIVITDISMSPIDGLELAREIQQIDTTVRIIFLTAYRDFEYARQALELKVVHYLLKHEISQNRLLEQLVLMRNDIEEEAIERRQTLRMLLKDALNGETLPGGPGNADLAFIPLRQRAAEVLIGRTAMLYFELNPVVMLDGSRRSARLPDAGAYRRIELEAARQAEEIQEIDVIELEGPGYAVLLKLSSSNSQLILQYTLHKISLLVQQAAANEGFTVPKVMTAVLSRADRSPQRAWAEMKQVYDYSLFLPKGAVFLLEQAVSAEAAAAASASKDAIQLPMGHEDLPALRDRLEEIVARADLRALKAVIRKAGEASMQEGAAAGEIALGSDARSIVEAIYTMVQQRAEGERQQASYSRWVVKAMAYVHDHYDNPELSLEIVAASLRISSIHLRTTFKKETGQSLLDYTTEYRIEQAKKLLLSGEWKIYEVSEKVGYKTSQYFSQVFRKLTGAHPKDFIRQESGS